MGRLPPAVGAIEASSPLQAVSHDLIVLQICRHSHRCDHAHHEDPDPDCAVDDTRGASVQQAVVTGQQGVLPCRLQDRNEADDADELEVALRRVSMQFAPSGICWSYAELLGLAHSRHFALILRGAALRLDGSLVQLHLLERRVVLRRPGFWD